MHAINYHNHTIRVADGGVRKDDCASLPLYPLSTYKLLDVPSSDSLLHPLPILFRLSTIEVLMFVTCEKPVYSPNYVETAPCINGSSMQLGHYSYMLIRAESAADVVVSCSIQGVYYLTASLPEGDMSFLDIHDKLVYGLELSWFPIYCKACRNKGYCTIDDYTDEVLSCNCPICALLRWVRSYLQYYASHILQ